MIPAFTFTHHDASTSEAMAFLHTFGGQLCFRFSLHIGDYAGRTLGDAEPGKKLGENIVVGIGVPTMLSVSFRALDRTPADRRCLRPEGARPAPHALDIIIDPMLLPQPIPLAFVTLQHFPFQGEHAGDIDKHLRHDGTTEIIDSLHRMRIIQIWD